MTVSRAYMCVAAVAAGTDPVTRRKTELRSVLGDTTSVGHGAQRIYLTKRLVVAAASGGGYDYV